jgi:hypothetical protein
MSPRPKRGSRMSEKTLRGKTTPSFTKKLVEMAAR